MDRLKRARKASDLQLKLAHQIIEFIKERKLIAGAHLKELELADYFDVSRSPVRATLEYLEGIDVVERRENRGYFLKRNASECMALSLDLPLTREDKISEKIARDWFENRVPSEVSESEIRKRYNLGCLMASRILQKLEDQRVVSRQPGYGWRFEPTLNTAAAHDDSYDFRILLESESLLLPTFELNENGAEQLMTRHNLILKSNKKAWNIQDLFQLDVDFHKFLAKCSGNRFVIDAIERQNRLRRLVEYVSLIDTNRLAGSCREHIQILDALQKKKRKLASKLMTQHLKAAKSFGPSFAHTETR